MPVVKIVLRFDFFKKEFFTTTEKMREKGLLKLHKEKAIFIFKKIEFV